MTSHMTPMGAVMRGAVAAVIGTAAMDLQEYAGYRLHGGKEHFLHWEFFAVQDWQQASSPGKAGERLIRGWTGQQPDPKWAGLTNNLMHWGFGIQGGVTYGIAAGSVTKPPLWGGIPLGILLWLFGYAVLPLAKIYKPLWDYDVKVLSTDLLTHLVYGAITGVVFRLLVRRRS